MFVHTRRPTIMSLFFFGNNFYKNKEIFKIFSPQLLEVYRILLVKTTLESIIFYYTFSVINTMFVSAVWKHSSNSNIKIVHNSIKYFLCNSLISFLVMSSLVCGLFSQTKKASEAPLKCSVREMRHHQ